MVKEAHWSTLEEVDGQTPKDLCNQLFLALCDNCDNKFLSFVDSNFLSKENAEAVKNMVFKDVDVGVTNFSFVQGQMERKMSSGAFSFRVFNLLMRRHKVFEVNDFLIIDGNQYYVGLSKLDKPILTGEGKFNNYSLRRFLSDGEKYSRMVNNPDLDWIGFINSLNVDVQELHSN